MAHCEKSLVSSSCKKGDFDVIKQGQLEGSLARALLPFLIAVKSLSNLARCGKFGEFCFYPISFGIDDSNVC